MIIYLTESRIDYFLLSFFPFNKQQTKSRQKGIKKSLLFQINHFLSIYLTVNGLLKLFFNHPPQEDEARVKSIEKMKEAKKSIEKDVQLYNIIDISQIVHVSAENNLFKLILYNRQKQQQQKATLCKY